MPNDTGLTHRKTQLRAFWLKISGRSLIGHGMVVAVLLPIAQFKFAGLLILHVRDPTCMAMKKNGLIYPCDYKLFHLRAVECQEKGGLAH